MSHAAARERPAGGAARRTLGFLVDWLEGEYQSPIARGVIDAARERNLNLLCFAGGVLGSDDRSSVVRNEIYGLPRPQNVDALVVMTGGIGNLVGAAGILELCAQYRPLPIVTVSGDLPGMPGVTVDNVAGLAEAIAHLVQIHEHRKIAFIRGPSQNQDAEQRFHTYREALKRHGLDFDARLVAEGNFSRESGAQAVAMLADERRIALGSLQAIVASNDEMALGACAELERRELHVPDDIALVGFDDIEEVRYSNPTLTTVRQPLYEQGQLAVQRAVDLLNGVAVPAQSVLPTVLVARRSCGCYARGAQLVHVPAARGRFSFEAELVQRREVILAELSRAARAGLGPLGSGWEQRLINAFSRDLRGDAGEAFPSFIQLGLDRLLEVGGAVGAFNDVLSALRQQVIPCVANDAAAHLRAEDLFQNARIAVGAALERSQAHLRLALHNASRSLSEVSANLLQRFDFDHLVAKIPDELGRLGLKRAFVVLYRNAEERRKGRLLVGFDSPRGIVRSGIDVSLAEVVPTDLLPTWEPYAFVVEPLVCDEIGLGYVVMECSNVPAAVIAAVPALLAAAIRGALMKGPRLSKPPSA